MKNVISTINRLEYNFTYKYIKKIIRIISNSALAVAFIEYGIGIDFVIVGYD